MIRGAFPHFGNPEVTYEPAEPAEQEDDVQEINISTAAFRVAIAAERVFRVFGRRR